MCAVCPKCLEQTLITVDVSDGDTLHCPGCGEEYSLDAVTSMIESWQPLIPWLKAHPARLQVSEVATS